MWANVEPPPRHRLVELAKESMAIAFFVLYEDAPAGRCIAGIFRRRRVGSGALCTEHWEQLSL